MTANAIVSGNLNSGKVCVLPAAESMATVQAKRADFMVPSQARNVDTMVTVSFPQLQKDIVECAKELERVLCDKLSAEYSEWQTRNAGNLTMLKAKLDTMRKSGSSKDSIDHVSESIRYCEIAKFRIQSEFERKKENIHRTFDEFVIQDSKTIQYGSKKAGNYMICRIGNGDSFRRVIWIEVNLVKDLTDSIKYPEIKEKASEYIALIKQYETQARMN